ncbi:TIGR03943 family protein [Cohnella sp. WQ 127256]|uniref:TIGR03943 family putative permease subunit n=1 Tax=Cohnella sp. WQ 127256 TaxID=2938790 RepID=UPI0021184E4C|nr:TIGR03943 family protein [Cohnella sp. WQ 127256]
MHKSSAALALHYLVRALILAGFAFFIVHLVRSGNLNLYIANRMQVIVKLAALGLYAIAAQQFYAAIRTWLDKNAHDFSCDCNHEMPATWGKSILLYSWFAFPLIIGFILPNGPLGSSLATAKGVQFAPQQLVNPSADLSVSIHSYPLESEQLTITEQSSEDTSPLIQFDDIDIEPKDTVEPLHSAAALDRMFPSDEFTESYAHFGKQLIKQNLIQVTDKQYIEALTTIDLYRNAFLGKTIELSGFVYREEGMERNRFGVSRFAVSCCSADASPFGVMVKFNKAYLLATDEWVTVTGKLGTTSYHGQEIIQLDVSKVVKIAPPDEPYVTPDLDFG